MTQPELLPEPEKLEAAEPEHFTVEASLVHRLGSESVSDQVLSMLELIKNSYDADATRVEITLSNLRTGQSQILICDNGTGMVSDSLGKGWMRVATSMKADQRLSPIFKRRMLGQKGIGRFAVENLSRLTTITSYPRDEKEGFVVRFDWEKYSTEADLLSVANERAKFVKDPKVHGLKIRLEGLRHKWTEDDVQRMRTFIRSLTPPAVTAANFEVIVHTDEFVDQAGQIESDFLKKAVFTFDAILAKTGEITYSFFKHNSEKPAAVKSAKLENFSCGPVHLKLYFYYRSKSKLKSFGVEFDSIGSLSSILDDYGGVKVYRDGVRLSGFGNPDDDWTGLDSMSRNDPSVVPSRNQIIAVVSISSEQNPEITDTTTRENIIKNQSFQDLLKFVQGSISVFAQMRGEIEQKRTPAPKQDSKFVKQAILNIQANKARKELLDFAMDYPIVFYDKLEEEINFCYLSSLPNATLVLSRKMVENLLYNILDQKFPKDVPLRYNLDQGRTLDFSILIRNLESKQSEFDSEQREIIGKFLQLVKPFKRDANSTAHKVIEYLDTIDDLDKLRVAEIIQLELQLWHKIK